MPLPPLALPVLVVVLPMAWVLAFEAAPPRVLIEAELEVLKESVVVAEEVPLLLAEAAPTAETDASPRLRFWPEELRLSELLLWFVVWLWLLSPVTLPAVLPLPSCAWAMPNASAIAVARIVRFICYSPVCGSLI